MMFRSVISTMLSQLEKEEAGRLNYTRARQALVQLEAPGLLLGNPWRNTHQGWDSTEECQMQLPVTKACMIFKVQTK